MVASEARTFRTGETSHLQWEGESEADRLGDSPLNVRVADPVQSLRVDGAILAPAATRILDHELSNDR
jgi:hypothetical protein